MQVLEHEGKLSWLEFVDELLDVSLTELKPKYELDGTHLHPSYVPLIGLAIDAIASKTNRC